jgi:hypothetical protein
VSDGEISVMHVQEIIRVGSSFDIHDCSSLWLGAARAWELAEVNKVNEKRFYIKQTDELLSKK